MKAVLLCLHGWGGSKESFTELRAALKGTDVKILTPDLPGFGKEPEPKKAWTITDYALWVEHVVEKQVLDDVPIHLLGHSHGGRIAIKIAYRGKIPLRHLYLCAAAGIRHPRHLRRTVGLILTKPGKLLLSLPGLKQLDGMAKKGLYTLFGVHDYEKASPVMRDTMINVTNEDLRDLLPSIRVPTDIFWGTKDTQTPVSDAHVMRKAIRGSKLHLFPGIQHRIHRDKAQEISDVIKERIA